VHERSAMSFVSPAQVQGSDRRAKARQDVAR